MQEMEQLEKKECGEESFDDQANRSVSPPPSKKCKFITLSGHLT